MSYRTYIHSKFTDAYVIFYLLFCFLSFEKWTEKTWAGKQVIFLIPSCFLLQYKKYTVKPTVLMFCMTATSYSNSSPGYVVWYSPCLLLSLTGCDYCKFQGFLNDPSPTVRATAVHGVFHIVALFWEVIPAHVVKELLTKIVSF